MTISDQISEFVKLRLNDKEDNRPLYQKIADALSEAVKSDLLGTNSVLPSERSLANSLAVSRVTIRRALDDLTASGLLNRRQGTRSSVAARVEKTLSSLTSFSEELKARGASPGQKWLFKQVVLPTPNEAMALGISPNDHVVRMTRVRFSDDIPIAIEKAVVPQTFLKSPDLVNDSLYEALRKSDFSPVRGVQRIRAGVMTRSDAEALESELGKPLLIVERRCYLTDERAVEFTETRYHGERYDFISDLQSQQFA
ncbi:GntR family transcriptional regulator [Ahrensia sp. 13_GOM-1096m]|jgi:GntR family transcriptional regulator|uniref:GntR family transcriptional regulator n=1 Tax=Ahrensia sp. 13_GOM-1096m TaxID=1380380 RepID=UPI00047BB2CE|nr:GntR family transcriptional regulator [Ahrensia sp. 13_GOM-1096m]